MIETEIIQTDKLITTSDTVLHLNANDLFKQASENKSLIVLPTLEHSNIGYFIQDTNFNYLACLKDNKETINYNKLCLRYLAETFVDVFAFRYKLNSKTIRVKINQNGIKYQYKENDYYSRLIIEVFQNEHKCWHPVVSLNHQNEEINETIKSYYHNLFILNDKQINDYLIGKVSFYMPWDPETQSLVNKTVDEVVKIIRR